MKKIKIIACALGGTVLALGVILGACALFAGYTLHEFDIRTQEKDIEL